MSVFEYLDQEQGGETPQPHMSDLWEWARDDYVAGESADVVCERHKLSRSRFFERARREGWLRRDQPRRGADLPYDAEADEAFVEAALDRPSASAYVLYRRAWARVERAILMSRRVEAAGWTRVAKDLRKLALEEHNTLSWKTVVTAEEADSAGSPSTSAAPPASAEPSPAATALTDIGKDPAPAPSSASEPGLSRRVCAEARKETAGSAGPDSADSVDALRPLNRQDRRRLAKLGVARVIESQRRGFRSADAMG